MAERAITKQVTLDGLNEIVLVRWNGLRLNDTGAVAELPGWRLARHQVVGTTGSSFELVMQACLDPGGSEFASLATYFSPLAGIMQLDANGAPISFVDHYASRFRPLVARGDVNTVIDYLALFVRGGAR